ncbi:beta-glucosidase [Paraburkholderia bryophila]|uniref:Glycosyl hydrolase family 39 n=1 Tax=Paraburkholderia bryophila TaxID=420952 RepID=A0A7Z0AYF6_9BURK|nr:beta-glucosidase [Paraburkholderia bryophila]NYH14494.1 hypothetical protein [Paraburkholderia bryophila]
MRQGAAWATAVCAAFSIVLANTRSEAEPAATLTFTNAPGSLIMEHPGPATLNFKIHMRPDAGVATVTVALWGRDHDGAPLRTPVATYSAIAQPELRMRVNLPHPGWFAAEARLTRRGVTLAERSIGVASVAPVAPSALPDAGVVTHFGQNLGDPEILMPLMRRAGLSWFRDEISWDKIEREPGNFVFPETYDRYVETAARFGLKPLIVLDYGNAVAYPGMFSGPQGFPQTVEERALFARYAAKVAKQYAKTVKHWEVWNEPSIGPISIENYAALLTSVSAAVKRQDPAAQVLACGGGGAGGGPGGDCLAALLKQVPHGVFDGVSIHPYMTPFDPDTGYPTTSGAWVPAVNIPTVWPHLRGMVARQSLANSPPVSVWVTEIGWPSSAPSTRMTDATQAAFLLRSWLLSRRYQAVAVMFWYDFVDDGTNPADAEKNFGLLSANLAPKPSYVAVSVLARTLGARKWTRTLAEDGRTKVYQYGGGSDVVVVGWRAGAGAAAGRIAVPPGKYWLRDWQGITRAIVVPPGGYAWVLGPMPQYLIAADGSAAAP